MLIGSVYNWYQEDMIYSIELLDCFVKGVEKQVAESIKRFEQEKERQVLEDASGEHEETYVRIVESHDGLDDESWNLHNLFEEYFPSLQRCSALLTVYSYVEHQLDRLCSLYEKERGLARSFFDLPGKGIERSTSYLEKVAGLDGLKSSKEWNRITGIRTIRNNIAHNGGRLRDHRGKPTEDVISEITKTKFIRGVDDEIVLEEGFLSEVVVSFMNYFRLISASIEASRIQNAKTKPVS
jgi:hypothetical protein